MLAEGMLQQVTAGLDEAHDLIAVARQHVRSADLIVDGDPEGAAQMLYDAARKSLTALLQAQGLRATARGGHIAVQDAVVAQFTKPPPRDAFAIFGRLRRERHGFEYDFAIADPDDVRADQAKVTLIVDTVERLIPALTVFVASTPATHLPVAVS